jgi:hypothetical protein
MRAARRRYPGAGLPDGAAGAGRTCPDSEQQFCTADGAGPGTAAGAADGGSRNVPRIFPRAGRRPASYRGTRG